MFSFTPEIKAGDPMWELELQIECFPKNGPLPPGAEVLVDDVEWGLFKHAMRNAISVEEKQPEIRSRVKAGMILWNKWAKEKVWTEIEDYKDVEAWKPSGSILQQVWRKRLYREILDKARAFQAQIDSEIEELPVNSSTQTLPNSSSRSSHKEDTIDNTSKKVKGGEKGVSKPQAAQKQRGEVEEGQRLNAGVTRRSGSSLSTPKQKRVGKDQTRELSTQSTKRMAIEGPGDDRISDRSKRAARRAERIANAEKNEATG